MKTGYRTPIARSAQAAAAAAIAAAFAWTPASADTSASRIVNCPDSDWCHYHRTIDKGWRHSPLAQINRNNVADLRPAWIFQPGEVRMGIHSTPLVVDGAMYLATNPSTVWKLDAATGERMWAFVPELDQAVVARSFFSHTRGLSVGDGRVYMGTADGRQIALDEMTGEVLWDVAIVDSAKETAGFSGPATFVNSDLYVVGQNGGEYPVEGKIFGIDPKNGDVKWTFYTPDAAMTPPSPPGAATRGNTAAAARGSPAPSISSTTRSCSAPATPTPTTTIAATPAATPIPTPTAPATISTPRPPWRSTSIPAS